VAAPNRERDVSANEDRDAATYRVVVNHEEQYSIWSADRELPAGWSDAGISGSRETCLAHIEEVWTDMRPLSLRKHMAEAGT
jgi:MbtH protein